MYKSQNPLNNKLFQQFDYITDIQLQQKLELSQKTFLDWRHTSLKTRANILHKVADLLDDRKNIYGELITIEMGKPISQALGEVEKCAWVCRYYADNATDFLKCRVLESSAKMSQVVYDPIGVVFAVMPWNFPFWQVFRFIAPAIMAGNVGLLKHASNVPQCALAIQTVIADAGAPEGLFQNLFVDYKQIESIIGSDQVQGVTLTGSNDAGAKVAQLAGKNIKKSVLELGGSDAFVIFEDADLNGALENAVMSRFLNNGQSCIAAKRFIVHEEIAEEFIANFQSLIENFKCGDPLDKNTFIGPLVNKPALQQLKNQVNASVKLGADILTGGCVDDEYATIYCPTLMVNVPDDAPVWREETFGPIVVVKIFSSDEEAIRLANDSDFGLGAAVWTSDMDRAAMIAKEMDVGTVAINGMVKSDPALPFGGIKASGYGRELSDYGIYEFVNIKTISYF